MTQISVFNLAKSKNPCPVCGNKTWASYALDDLSGHVFLLSGMALVDFIRDDINFIYRGFRSHVFDVCLKCETCFS